MRRPEWGAACSERTFTYLCSPVSARAWSCLRLRWPSRPWRRALLARPRLRSKTTSWRRAPTRTGASARHPGRPARRETEWVAPCLVCRRDPASSLLRGVPGYSGNAIQLNDESNLDGGGGLGGYVATPVGLEVWEGRKPFSLNLWVKWNGYRQWRGSDRSAGLAGSYRGFPYHIGWALYIQGGAPAMDGCGSSVPTAVPRSSGARCR